MKPSYKNKRINDEILILIKLQREGNKLAESRILKLTYRFVWKVAKKFTRDEQLQKDLVQEAELALLKEAIPRFDLSSNASFCSYAIFWIMHAMEVYLKDNLFVCKLPSHAETYLRAQKISIDEVDHGKSLFNYIVNNMSVNQSFKSSSGKDIFDTISSTDYFDEDKRIDIDKYLSLIEYSSTRNKDIIKKYFKENKSLRTLGKEYKISGERIRQIVESSKSRIKNKLIMEGI